MARSAHTVQEESGVPELYAIVTCVQAYNLSLHMANIFCDRISCQSKFTKGYWTSYWMAFILKAY